MRSCLVLGSGRSGTSMLAGTLAVAGYYMGEDLYPARDSNPKGFFEGPEINGINEELIRAITPVRPRGPLGRFFRRRPGDNQRWLARVPFDVTFKATPELLARIREQVKRAPFCFKDPRFCYTLPVWRERIGDVAFLCVFRDPGATVRSILKECREIEYLSDLSIDARRAYEVWTLMYRHVLEKHSEQGDWLFLHFDQLIDGSAGPRIEALLGVRPDMGFPDAQLRRSNTRGDVPPETLRVYGQLLERSEKT